MTIHHGDCLQVMRGLPDASVDAVVTDPPYLIGFMGKGWDGADGIAGKPEVWREALRLLKPGGHLLAFGGTRTWHRLAVAIEDAGFEVRDSIAWLYGSGFPKSLDVSKAIDKAAGAEREVVGQRTTGIGTGKGTVQVMGDGTRDITAPATPEAQQWQGWGTALKPVFEPIVVARKPLTGTVAANVLEHGTGALNIDGCRIGTEVLPAQSRGVSRIGTFENADGNVTPERSGRWPANVVLDEDQADALDRQSGHDDSGGASRFFYCPKAPTSERPKVDNVAHPTVKPLALMRYLCRLVTPPGGVILEPFAGSGTTVEAALREGFNIIAIERETEYLPLIQERLDRMKEETDGQLDLTW